VEKNLGEIAAYIGGEVSGDASITIKGLNGITEAGPGEITFIANPRYRRYLSSTKASAIIAPYDIERPPQQNMIYVKDPYVAFGKLLAWFYPEEKEAPAISPAAFIDPTAQVSSEATVYASVYIGPRAKISKGVVLHPGVVIGHDVKIGEGSILYPNVVVYPRCIIGARVIIHGGVIIGADGFGFAHPGRENIKIPQVGIVQIDDEVEIGANSTVDRATIGRTWIKRGAKIDNLVQIGHNVTIGERTVIVSQVGISGSTKIGDGVILGGQVGIVGHVEVGDNCMVAARSAIHSNVAPGQIVAGAPQMPYKKWLRMIGAMVRLPEYVQKLKDLTNRIDNLEKKLREGKT